MKAQIILLGTLALFMFGACNNTNVPEDPVTKNQPADPSSWSPAGKRYLCDRSGDKNPYGYEFYMSVIHFIGPNYAVWYGTTHEDLSRMETNYNPANYTMDYPKVTFDFYGVIGNYHFIDTLTLSAAGGIHILEQ